MTHGPRQLPVLQFFSFLFLYFHDAYRKHGNLEGEQGNSFGGIVSAGRYVVALILSIRFSQVLFPILRLKQQRKLH